MENEKKEISNDLIESLSIDNLVDLKVEVDNIVSELDNIIEDCNIALNY